MSERQYDTYLTDVLRKVRSHFAFAADYAYPYDLPAELVWVLIRALVSDKGLTVNQSARVVLNYIERNCAEIPRLLGCMAVSESLEQEETEEKQRRTFLH